ncbi:MAG: translationally-controlled tumor protein [archaeon]|nr:translationally-controlled tumor protein [archaeon]
MYIYSCIFSGDEFFSDVYPNSVLEDVLFAVEAKYVTKEEGGSFGIEGDDVDEATNSVKVLNIADASDLMETQIDKKGYIAHIKKYMRSVKEKLTAKGTPQAELDVFQAGAAKVVKDLILPNFNQLQFWVGKSCEADGMIAISKWSEDGSSCVFWFWKHGLIGNKV